MARHLLLFALLAVLVAGTSAQFGGMGAWMRGMMRGPHKPMMEGCRAARDGGDVVLSGLQFRGGELTTHLLPAAPQTMEELRALMMGADGASAEATSLECQQSWDEAAGAASLRIAPPQGCRAARVCVFCEECRAGEGGPLVSKMLNSEALEAPQGEQADGSAFVVVLRGATLPRGAA